MYQASLQTILSNEINSRRIRDIDRMTEDLAVLLEADQNGISIILKNKSPLLINVLRIWAVDTRTGAPINSRPCINQPNYLHPGSNSTVEVTDCVSMFTGRAQFIAVTERGRMFASNIIELSGGRVIPGLFPYTLTISAINMKRGDVYQVVVTPLDQDSNINPKSITYKATASNENISLAFSSTAGVFEVSLYENGILVSSSRLLSPDSNPRIVIVPDVTSVVFMLLRVEITPVEMDVEIIAPNQVLEGSSFSFSITVRLPPTAREAVEVMKNILASLVSVSGDVETASVNCDNEGTLVLEPGQTGSITCYASAAELGGGRSGSITIEVSATPELGTGKQSSLPYPSDSDTVSLTVKRQRGR